MRKKDGGDGDHGKATGDMESEGEDFTNNSPVCVESPELQLHYHTHRKSEDQRTSSDQMDR